LIWAPTAFDWGQFCRTKGAAKFHLPPGYEGFLPCYAVITEGKQREMQGAQQWSYPAEMLLVMDRGQTAPVQRAVATW